MEKKVGELERLYLEDKARRLENTVKIFKEIANECMDGEERESFLTALGEGDEKSPKK